MPRPSSSRRRPTSRQGTVSSTPTHSHELSTKRRGELAELAFTLKAASMGFAVSKPYGDSERYDFILDARADIASEAPNPCHPERGLIFAPKRKDQPQSKACPELAEGDPFYSAAHKDSNRLFLPSMPCQTLHRIQVKCSTQLLNGLYRINAHRRTRGRALPYLASEIDFLAAYIIPEDTWYIIPIHAVRATSLLFRRKTDPKPGLYDQYREAWHLLRNP